MATSTGINRDLAIIGDWSSDDAVSGAVGNITAAASHAFGTTLTVAGHGRSIGDIVRVAGTATTNDGRYDGQWEVLAVPSSSQITIAAPFLSNQTTGTIQHRSTRGNDLVQSTTADLTIGNGTVKSQVRFDERQTLVINRQILMYENDDGSPNLIIGSDRAPVLILDANANGNWADGGTFRRAAAGENPVIRFIRCNYIKVTPQRESGFGGNLQEIICIADRCNFAWMGPRTVPFMGTGGIWQRCTFTGAINQLLSPDHSFFLATPRVFTDCVIARWGLGLKQEYGSAFFGSVQFTDCAVEAFTSRNQITAGQSDGAINLVDSLFNPALVGVSYEAILRAWRTVRVTSRAEDGTAVAGAILYAMDGTTERRFSLSVNASANASGYYQMEAFDLNEQDGTRQCRDVAYLFRIGDSVDVSGFTTAANNGRKTVRGRLFGGTRYADPRLLEVNEAVTAEASAAVTLSISPPRSNAQGVVPDHRLPVFSAQAKTFGNNAWHTSGNNQPMTIQDVLDNLTAIQAGTYRRGSGLQDVIESDAFHRPSWKMVLIPPYPWAIREITVATPMNTGGAPIEWNPTLAHDPDVSVTAAATVAAYTEISTLQEMYDYLVWYKAQEANHSFPRHDLPIVRKVGSALDFGSLEVTLDVGLSSVVTRTANGISIKVAATFTAVTAFTRIKTTGAVTMTGNTSVPVVIEDTNGTTGRLTVTCADSAASVAVFAPDGTQRGTIGTGSLTVALSAAQSVAGMKVVAARTGYAAQVRTVSMAGGGARTEAFGALARLDLPDGTWMLTGASLSDAVSVAFDTSDLTAVRETIDIGNALAGVRTILIEAETAQVAAPGLKYLAFGGGQFGVNLSPTAGDSLFMPSSSRLRRASAGDSNSGVLGTVFHRDGTPIDGSRGQVQIAAGISTTTLAQALFVDYDVDAMTPGTQSIAGELLATKTAAAAARTAAETGRTSAAAARTAAEAAHTAIGALTIPTANQIRDTLLAAQLDGTSLELALEALLAVVAGRVVIDEEARTATFGSLESTPVNRARVTYDENGNRTGGQVLG